MASSSHLKPGEKGMINVSVDVRGKMGRITKTVKVETNDPKKPLTRLFVSVNVKDELHLQKYAASEIFGDRCRSCHVEKGRGKTGFDLFRADCLMCHNTGKSASSLGEMGKKPREYIFMAIKEGVEDTSMPGFYLENGGPLNDAEIESLTNVIKPAGR